MTATRDYDTSPIGPGPNWVTHVDPVEGLGPFVRAVVHELIRAGHPESEAVEIALGVMKRWAAGGGNVTPKTIAKATQAVAHWGQLKAEAAADSAKSKRAIVTPEEVLAEVTRLRDMTGEGTDAIGALLPVGPSQKQDDEIHRKLVEKHRFVGSTLDSCEQCGQPVTASVHRKAKSEVRHSGLVGHEHTVTGHIKGNFHRHVQAGKSQAVADQNKIEPRIEAAIRDYFGKQRTAVISRLTGKRGKTMLKRASDPPRSPEGVPVVPPSPLAGATAAAITPDAVFDPVFWANALEKVLQTHYALAAEVATNRVKGQVGAPAVEDLSALKYVSDILAIRAQREAGDITATTRQSIYEVLQAGVVAGDSLPEITKAINEIFDNADEVRARMIAQTETVGALNQAAHTYANNLPDGTVGSHTWLSHHDDRTRPHHREADGQTVPISRPFYVGGWPMLFPGDPSAPPDEVINCRCSQAFLPPDMSMGQGVLSAKNLAGLIPQSSLDALEKMQSEQAANRKKLVAATANVTTP